MAPGDTGERGASAPDSPRRAKPLHSSVRERFALLRRHHGAVRARRDDQGAYAPRSPLGDSGLRPMKR
jgi:hypothetical protein